MDKDVCHPFNYDFFLCAHAGLIVHSLILAMDVFVRTFGHGCKVIKDDSINSGLVFLHIDGILFLPVVCKNMLLTET